MDTIWQAAFGVDIDMQNKHDNFYFSQCEKFIREFDNFKIIHYFASKFYLSFFFY